ncbi:MAG: DUF2726 domain-containing protein [Pseudomonadota bacterium]
MRMDLLFWGVTTLALASGLVLGWAMRGRRSGDSRDWPRRWRLNARPVFTADERALFKELRSALPNHVVLAKLNLLRFCQAADEFEARSWYDRLHTLHVSFAICTPNGTVVSVIDVEPAHKAKSQRSQKMKEAVLEACRVRYVRCRAGQQWPQQALMAAWALGQMAPVPTTVPGALAPASNTNTNADSVHDAGDQLARKLRERRAERAARWAESSFAQDSFFATDSRFDGLHPTNPMPLQTSGK